MGRQRPASVTNAIRAQWALVVVGAVGTALTWVLRDDLLADWASGRGGLDAVEASGIAVPAFVPVAVVTYLVYVSLAWVLGVLFAHGHAWARWSLLAMAAGAVFAASVAWQAGPPLPFVVFAALTILLDVLLAFFLLQRDTGEWTRGTELAEEHEHAS